MWIFYFFVLIRIEVIVVSNVIIGGIDGNIIWWNFCINFLVIIVEGVFVVRCSFDFVKYVLKLRILVYLFLFFFFIVIFVLNNYNYIVNLNKIFMFFIWIYRVNVFWLKMKYILFLFNIVKVLLIKLYKV